MNKYKIPLIILLLLLFEAVGCDDPPVEPVPSDEPEVCLTDPNSLECTCAKNPESSGCVCLTDPNAIGCKCILAPQSKACICSRDPDSQECKVEPEECKNGNESTLQCECAKDPTKPLCHCLDSSNTSAQADPACSCLTDPNSFECFCSKESDNFNCQIDSGSAFCEALCVSKEPLSSFRKEVFEKYGHEDCELDGIKTYGSGIDSECYLENDLDEVVCSVADPCLPDTDGDGLPDFIEFEFKSSARSKDTDGDGVSDFDEYKFKLNPSNGKSDGETPDAKRWIVNACSDSVRFKPVNYVKDDVVDYQIALANSISYEKLSGVNSQNYGVKAGALLFDDDGNGVTGGLFSLGFDKTGRVRVDDSISAINYFVGKITSWVSGPINKVDRDFVGGRAKTHDNHEFAPAEFVVTTKKPMSISTLRDSLMVRLGGFDSTHVNSSSGVSAHVGNQFLIKMTAIYRAPSGGSGIGQVILTYALAKYDFAKNNEDTLFRIEDLVDTTAIARSIDDVEKGCAIFFADQDPPKANFYFIFDESGSMGSYNENLSRVASEFWKVLQIADLDYEMGVTNLQFGNHISGFKPVFNQSSFTGVVNRWTNEIDLFKEDLGHIKSDDGYIEQGLTAGVVGICTMTRKRSCREFNGLNKYLDFSSLNVRDKVWVIGNSQLPFVNEEQKIRKNSTLITIWVGDERDEYFQQNWKTFENSKSELADFIDFYSKFTTGFAIVQDDLWDFKYVAQGTGGAYTDLKNTDTYAATMETIIRTATGLSSNFNLPTTPISSTLTLYKRGIFDEGGQKKIMKEGSIVHRSRKNGYNYTPSVNSISFFGDKIPKRKDNNSGYNGDEIVVRFEYYVLRSKD